MDYDYEIDAATGQILKKEAEIRDDFYNKVASGETAAQKPQAATGQKTTSGTAQNQNKTQTGSTKPAATPSAGTVTQSMIGIEKAKEIALSDAGQKAGGVIFSKAKQDRDDGKIIYDVEFYVEGVAEYDYEIDAYTGSIRERSNEPWESEDTWEVNAIKTITGQTSTPQTSTPAA
ncbi:MAG: PepSY domain-containing protein, partial [Lachnospiraceae bacterium]|nr:PepSY domain-containing protein [Lachnospiraceae bacterium]